MDNFYDRLVENLGKLRRNEEKMTPQQKEQYKRPLQKLRRDIAQDATTMMKDFLCGGCRILKEDQKGIEAFTKKVKEIMEEDGEGAAKEASRVIFSTYSVDKFLEALLPIHYRILYEAYAPVWLSHCRKREEPGYPYRNDIIQMDWEEKSGVWVDREKVSFMQMLPPTKELMEKQYAEEKGRLK